VPGARSASRHIRRALATLGDSVSMVERVMLVLPSMNSTPRSIDFTRSGPWFALLLGLAPLAFWSPYLSKVFDGPSAYTHLHAITATLWLLLLIVQPLAIAARRFTLHRRIGQAAWVLGPMVVASIVLLAHSSVKGQDVAAFANVLYLQLSLAAVFGLSYALAMITRRTVALHARFMVCTGLTMLDPVLARFMYFWWDWQPGWSYAWITFGLADLILLGLIWLERRRPTGRAVFPVMLVIFVVTQLPVVLRTKTAAWHAFVSWFASLPLT
jgi:hypothetical protein